MNLQDLFENSEEIQDADLEELTTEDWKPRNQSKHRTCQQRIKNRVSVWPSAYASGQVVQCYYGKKRRKKS